MASSLTLKVIAGGSGFTDGSVATYNYTITVGKKGHGRKAKMFAQAVAP